jgi:hypothetical protein
MQTSTLSITLAALALGAGVLVTMPAHAHIDMKGALESRGGNQKSSPCDGARDDGPVYTFAPGATITLAVDEGVAHPSYFRIAFDDDGDDDFVEPKSIKPVDPKRKCPFDANDQCGESDFCNVTSSTGGASVLWDNLDPHLANAGKGGSWNIKLPDVECDNCTLQVLQIMEDTVHGPYCPKGMCSEPFYIEDIYHRCINIKLVKGATDTIGVTTAPIANNGMECAKSVAPPTGKPATDAGVSTSSDAGPVLELDESDASATKPRDAGAPRDEEQSAAPDDDEQESDVPAIGAKRDAGKPTVKKDAGKPSSDSDDDRPVATNTSDEGGCAVGPSASGGMSGAVWSLLALGACVVRRRRARAA